ncbi:MAG: class I SAM-dependent methyltransferase [Myxococcales bacterium]|nr:class I SAM-dependent methyltransferase [Myxococcales bacterium]
MSDGGVGSGVVETLIEALAEDPRPTLVWGERLGAPTPYRAALPEVAFATDDLETAKALGIQATVLPKAKAWARIVIVMPKAKAQLLLRLALAESLVEPGGAIWVVGHQRDGIRSAEAVLAERYGECELIRGKRHCRVAAAWPGETSARPELDGFEARFTAPGPGGAPLSVVSLPGVFGHGRLDLGTRHLLDVLAADVPAYARALDLGAGAGVLGAFLARARPRAEVVLADVSATACEASRRTLAANGLTGGVLLTEADELAPGAFDLVVSNPPRHEGRAHAHDLAGEVIAGAARRLGRGGRFLCVANHDKHVTRALEASFSRVEVRYHDPAYRVWDATR